MEKEKAESNALIIEHELENLHELYLNHRYKEFWVLSKQIVGSFKTLKPLLRKDRERLWSNYSNICETARQEMASRREETKSNASKIGQEINNLRYNHLDQSAPNISPIIPFPTTRYHYREFWGYAKQISEMFKEFKLLKEDRERLWLDYRAICDEVKARQNEERYESERSYETIEHLITDAYFQTEGSNNKEDLDKAKSMQTETLGIMKKSRLLKEDREKLWKYWKETNEKIFYKRQGLQESNFLNAKEDASRCLDTAYNGDPHKALQEIKETQKSLHGAYINKDQRHEIKETLGDAWDKAISRIGEIKEERKRKHEEWLQRQEERKRKHEEWQERMESNIERWENSVEKAEDYISNLEEQIDRLEGEASDARTDEYAERVRGWIEEKQEKIREVREKISELEKKYILLRAN